MYLYGDRLAALTWNDQALMMIWANLDCAGTIHSLMPMHIVDE